MWTQPHLQTPEQFQCWTDVLAAVVNQIVLSRDLLAETRRAWERNARPSTLEQVRRGLAGIIAQLGTPAQPCQPRGYSRGSLKGVLKKPSLRFPIVKKLGRSLSKTPLDPAKTAQAAGLRAAPTAPSRLSP